MGAPMPAVLRDALNRQHPPEWAITCPGCHAKPNSPCRAARGRLLAAGSHPSRLDAWLVQQTAA
jgi:hypothetical protein